MKRTTQIKKRDLKTNDLELLENKWWKLPFADDNNNKVVNVTGLELLMELISIPSASKQARERRRKKIMNT